MLLGITLLSVVPSLLLMMTSFTKIFVVLALTRNALGLTGVPPNQVLAGLALFLSLFIMAPVLSSVNELGVQPYLSGGLDFAAALDAGSGPLRDFMLGQTREEDIALITRAAEQANPADAASVPMLTLIPSFMLSELRAAFIIDKMTSGVPLADEDRWPWLNSITGWMSTQAELAAYTAKLGKLRDLPQALKEVLERIPACN